MERQTGEANKWCRCVDGMDEEGATNLAVWPFILAQKFSVSDSLEMRSTAYVYFN